MKLADALKVIRSSPASNHPLPVALLCGFTPSHLQTFLRAHLCKLSPDRCPDVQVGLFGDLVGNLERIANVSAAAILIEWADLDPRLGLRRAGGWDRSQLPDILKEVERSCELLHDRLTELARGIPSVVCFPTLPLVPVSFTPLAQASEFTLDLRSRIASVAAALSRQSGVKIVDPARLDAMSPTGRLDVNSDLASGFPYTLHHASALAELLARSIVSPQPKKGLITDLDDTLWRGILGEVGVQGISWDLDDHSQIHALYQQLLRALASSGSLIAVASKNEASLVEEAFAVRDTVLPKSAIFPFEVHWRAKSESVTRILSAWNVSAEDVVCVDDNPMELAEIKSVHPGVECLLFPREDPQACYELLLHLRDLFGKAKISPEDDLRLASIRSNAEFISVQQHAKSISADDFIRQIQGKLTVCSRKEPLDPRYLELVNKTNQFNLNGRRFQEVEWKNWLDAPDTILLAARYRDKFGTLGNVSVIVGNILADDAGAQRRLYVRTWVMSCRAFSRFIEYDCIRWLFANYDVEELVFDFCPTLRNTPMRDFLVKVIEAPLDSHCRLSKAQFASKYPASIHEIEEVAHA